MKKGIIVSLLAFSTCFIYAKATVIDTSKVKKAIEKEVKNINAQMVTYRKVVKDSMDEDYRWHFFKGNELKLVKLKVIDETIEKNVEWYFDKGHIIYSEVNWFRLQTKELVQNQKVYVHNEEIIEWLSSIRGKIEPGSEEFKKSSEELMKYSKKLLED